MADLAGAKATALEFVPAYYGAFDADRSQLESIFADVSIMTFENETLFGKDAIKKKLIELPFKTIKHIITTCDGQPTIDGGIFIHVVGQLKTDEDAPHGFSETFHLKKGPSGTWVVLNNIFRLNLHHG